MSWFDGVVEGLTGGGSPISSSENPVKSHAEKACGTFKSCQIWRSD